MDPTRDPVDATENIDGLHVKAGTDPDRVVEVDPTCSVCGGITRSATILFGLSLVAAGRCGNR